MNLNVVSTPVKVKTSLLLLYLSPEQVNNALCIHTTAVGEIVKNYIEISFVNHKQIPSTAILTNYDIRKTLYTAGARMLGLDIVSDLGTLSEDVVRVNHCVTSGKTILFSSTEELSRETF